MISQKSMHVITKSGLGGAQRYVLDCAQADIAKQIDTVIVSDAKKGWLYQQALAKQINYQAIHHLDRNINIINDFFSMVELYKIIRKEKPTHLYLNSSKISFIGALIGKICGLKDIIYTVHGWVFNEPMPRFKKQLYINIEKISAHWKDKIVFINHFDLEIAKKLSIGKPEQYSLINLQIESISFLKKEEAKMILGSKVDQDFTNKKIVGTIANFFSTKNLDALIDIAQQLKEVNDLIFVIIGNGPEEKRLKKKIIKYKLKNVFLLGQIENAAIYLKAFDLFVLTSVKEGSPYVLLEAKQANIPILATPVGGVPEMLPKDQLCPVSQMAEKIKTIIM